MTDRAGGTIPAEGETFSSDPFIDSLGKVTVKDVVGEKTVRPKKYTAQTLIRLLIVLVCLGVFIYSTIMLIDRINDYGESEDFYDSLADMWYSGSGIGNNPFGKVEYSFRDFRKSKTYDLENSEKNAEALNGEAAAAVDSEQLIWIKSKLNALKSQCRDIAGWIKIDNTLIDYPIVQTDNNEFYLNHRFDGEFSKSGAIFVDYRNNRNFSDNKNTVIYGHNTLAKQMFGELDKFFTKSFFKNNKFVFIYTDQGIYKYEIFCVAKVNIFVDYTRTYFYDSNDFLEFVYAMKSRSVYKTDAEFTANDRILTLSTCTNSYNNEERYCIMAKLIEIQK